MINDLLHVIGTCKYHKLKFIYIFHISKKSKFMTIQHLFENSKTTTNPNITKKKIHHQNKNKINLPNKKTQIH